MRSLTLRWLTASTLLLVLTAAAQSPWLVVDGPLVDGRFGFALARAGDVDADGFPDLVVGAKGSSTTVGHAYVVSTRTGAFLATVAGDAIDDEFGFSVDGGHDVDGDGTPDFVVGAPSADPGGRAQAGRASVFSGRTGALLHAVDGLQAGDHTGRGVALLGDVDGDGRSEILVGADGVDQPGNAAGRVRAYSGATLTLLYELSGNGAGRYLGYAVCRLDDLDGDGRADFAVGIPRLDSGVEGSVGLYSGATGALLRSISGLSAGDEFGTVVAHAGDVDGDGIDDVLVGAPSATAGAITEAGKARLVSGRTGATLLTHAGAESGERLGLALAGGLDADGDARADYLVGAPNATLVVPDAGRAFFVSGMSYGTTLTFGGTSAADRLGHSIALLPDVSGDGLAEIVVGADQTDGAGTNTGRITVYPGSCCLPATGQRNDPRATMLVNGVGASGCRGPFTIGLPPSGGLPLSFEVLGPPLSPVVLVSGPRNPGHANYGCVGIADIGSPPGYTDVVPILNGTLPTLPDLLFRLDATGSLRLEFSMPASLAVGTLAHLQAIVFQDALSPCPIVLSAAFTLYVR